MSSVTSSVCTWSMPQALLSISQPSSHARLRHPDGNSQFVADHFPHEGHPFPPLSSPPRTHPQSRTLSRELFHVAVPGSHYQEIFRSYVSSDNGGTTTIIIIITTTITMITNITTKITNIAYVTTITIMITTIITIMTHHHHHNYYHHLLSLLSRQHNKGVYYRFNGVCD